MINSLFMYLFKKNTSYLIKLKIYLLLILSILFFFTNTYAEEKFIGFIDTLEGKAVIIKGEDTVSLNEFDQIFINNKIEVDEGTSLIISFIDNSLLTLKGKSEFSVKEFDKTSSKPSFILSIPNGKFSFESGSIAKDKKGIIRRTNSFFIMLNFT